MKILICNIPLRSESSKTVYPPLGALAVIQSLHAAGYDASFFDVNVFRPSDVELEDYFTKNRYDIVGISATVSTSYGFVKKTASLIKRVSPRTIIIAGGALTASAEILLRFSQVDFCVIGEGEKIIVNLVRHISSEGIKKDEDRLKNIKGICFLNNQAEAVFTGYEQQLSVGEIRDADYSIIEKYSEVDSYIIEPFFYEQFKYDERVFEPHRKGKKLATVVSSRGCVNRCTFCHRWQQGIRIFPVDRLMHYIQYLQKEYNVGFISFGDEDFGATKKWIEEFVEKIKPLDILYRISGVCANNVDLSILRKFRNSGCVAVHYGFESGSDRILKVMGKNATVDLNSKVAGWTSEAQLQTVHALVVGMPGESFETIRETADFVKRTTEWLPREPIISINALVALPGAPVYEYARHKGFLGKTLADEENYLLRVSNQGGGSLRQLNLTEYPYFIVHGWINFIYWEVIYNYYLKNGLPRLTIRKMIVKMIAFFKKRKSPAANFSESIFSLTLFFRLRYIISPAVVMLSALKEDKKLFLQRLYELLRWPFKKKIFTAYISVRSMLKEASATINPDSVEVLRLGR